MSEECKYRSPSVLILGLHDSRAPYEREQELLSTAQVRLGCSRGRRARYVSLQYLLTCKGRKSLPSRARGAAFSTHLTLYWGMREGGRQRDRWHLAAFNRLRVSSGRGGYEEVSGSSTSFGFACAEASSLAQSKALPASAKLPSVAPLCARSVAGSEVESRTLDAKRVGAFVVGNSFTGCLREHSLQTFGALSALVAARGVLRHCCV